MVHSHGRHIALLAGTSTLSDSLYALGRLAVPQHLVDGPALGQFEQRLAQAADCRFGTAYAASRVGFYGLLSVLGVGAGAEILLPVPTHVVVANAVRYAGATPVYVDCQLTDYNLDMRQAAEHITPATRAMLLQHTFGVPADIDAALRLAEDHHLVVIEDCVHALGGRYHGRALGAFGQAAFFSTEETKIISTTMGGVVTTNNAALDRTLRGFQAACQPPGRRRVYGNLLKFALYYGLLAPRVHRYTRAVYEGLGRRLPLPRPTSAPELLGARPPDYLTRLSQAQAQLGLRQLARLPANLAHRRRIAGVYAETLQQRGLRRLVVSPDSEPAYVRYPVWVTDRAEAERRYRQHGVLGTWFTSVLEEAIDPARLGYVPGSCPNAELAAAHLVNLPTHPRVSEADAHHLLALILDLVPPG